MKNNNWSRKKFIKSGVLAAGSLMALNACKPESTTSHEAPNIISNKKYEWKMVTTWPPNFPVLGEGCNLFAKWVDEMSGGRLKIKVYGGGELIPALQAFEAVSSGAVEMASGVSYYWSGINPASQFFASIPFGFNAQQMNAWLYYGGGLELWQDLYAQYNLKPMPAGNTGVQMAGWFNREINNTDDFKGLKMRMPGLGGKVLNELGATAVLSAGSEIYTNLERGVIDATEWIGPYHDYLMGFHKIAKYYYAPGWHEPGSTLEFMFNNREFDLLPKDLQVIIEVATAKLNVLTLSEFESKNNEYVQKIKADSKVEFRTLPDDVLLSLKNASENVLEELVTDNIECKKIYSSIKSFKTNISQWANKSEMLYYNKLM
jgi:TRAP-type mannitol/chloroaromatic compound transport system substrate-binding protein